MATIFIACVYSVLAQGTWQPGFIITPKADTLYGYLENNDLLANTQFCNFRMSDNQSATKYTPEDILGFRFTDGKFFVSRDIRSSEFNGPIFMEYLVQGQANIYRYTNERYFIETVDGIEELKNTEELVERAGDKYIQVNREYQLLLNYFMREANMAAQIKTVRYNSKSLINIAKKYHERVCDDEVCIIYEKSLSNLEWRYRISGGLSLSQFNFGKISETNFSTGGYGGLGVELRSFSPWMEKFSVSLDVMLTRHTTYSLQAFSNEIGVPVTYEGEYFILSKRSTARFIGNSDFSATVLESTDVAINPMALKIPVVINFYFSKGTWAPYTGLGGIATFIVSENEDFTYHYYLDALGASIPTSNFGGVARVGIAYQQKSGNEIALEINIEQTRSSNPNRSLRLNNRVLTAGLSFSF